MVQGMKIGYRMLAFEVESGFHQNWRRTSFIGIYKVFDKVILENKFSSKICQFRNKKETQEFKHLLFYGNNNLSPKLTKNHLSEPPIIVPL